MINTSYIFGILVIVFLSSCNSEPAEEKREQVPVEIRAVEQLELPAIVSSTGRLSSKKEIKLSFKTAGIIRSMHAEEGDRVQKGEVLAGLDLSELKSNKQQAQTNYDKARRDYQRAKSLYEDSAATLEQYQNAESALQAAEAQLQIVDFNMEHSVIRAPVDGRILKQLAEPSEIVAAGMPVYLFAALDQAWVVRAGITAGERNILNKGDTATIKLTGIPNKQFKAVLTEKGVFADPHTGTFQIELTLVNFPENPATGLIAKAEIVSNEKEHYNAIPVDAMLEGKDNRVWVYRYTNGKAVKETIEIEAIRDDKILIRSGLEKEDTVITSGAMYVTPEAELNVKNNL
ncbi:MAG: efflux RND transporter periplasmic adaptor subunit [Bacteroidales bacterium]